MLSLFDQNVVRKMNRPWTALIFAAVALTSCQMDESQVSQTMPSTKTQSSVMPDDVQDGWQCNSPLPVGTIVDRRNDLVMWRVGTLPRLTRAGGPIFILAAGKANDPCRFYFVDDYDDSHFIEPILYPFERSMYAPFSDLLAKVVEDNMVECKADASANSLKECRRRVQDRVVGSASQIASARPGTGSETASTLKSYLFINGAVFNTRGDKL
jgi:hypothetical protein